MVLYYLPEIRVQEEEIGFMLARQYATPCDHLNPITDNLDETQSNAVVNACDRNFSVLCGKAGTGKTTTLKRIVQSYIASGMSGTALCPTGKAAKRFQEVVYDEKINNSVLPARTIASCLQYWEGKFSVNEDNQLDTDFVIVDETSMCDVAVFNALLRSIDWKKTRVVITGDENQLPSIGPGNILTDILSCNFPITRLTRIYRQGKDSGIVKNASRILEGQMPTNVDEDGTRFTDCEFIPTDKDRVYSSLISKVTESLPLEGFRSLEDIQVLCPGKRGNIGTENLNKELRTKLNTVKKTKFLAFMVGDKVINRKNNYDLCVVNGDVGFVTDISDGGIVVDFGKGAGRDGSGVVRMNADQATNLKLAYAYTVHSSQGSEFPCCVIPIYSIHWMLLFRNLLYTAMTRPSKKLVVYYEAKSLSHCVKNNSPASRLTNLPAFINKYMSYFGVA